MQKRQSVAVCIKPHSSFLKYSIEVLIAHHVTTDGLLCDPEGSVVFWIRPQTFAPFEQVKIGHKRMVIVLQNLA